MHVLHDLYTQLSLAYELATFTAAFHAFRGFTAAVLSKPAESIEQRHPWLVSAAQLLFGMVLQFGPIANRQNQVGMTSASVFVSVLLQVSCNIVCKACLVQLKNRTCTVDLQGSVLHHVCFA